MTRGRRWPWPTDLQVDCDVLELGEGDAARERALDLNGHKEWGMGGSVRRSKGEGEHAAAV